MLVSISVCLADCNGTRQHCFVPMLQFVSLYVFGGRNTLQIWICFLRIRVRVHYPSVLRFDFLHLLQLHAYRMANFLFSLIQSYSLQDLYQFLICLRMTSVSCNMAVEVLWLLRINFFHNFNKKLRPSNDFFVQVCTTYCFCSSSKFTWHLTRVRINLELVQQNSLSVSSHRVKSGFQSCCMLADTHTYTHTSVYTHILTLSQISRKLPIHPNSSSQFRCHVCVVRGWKGGHVN